MQFYILDEFHKNFQKSKISNFSKKIYGLLRKFQNPSVKFLDI